jgi:rhamnogalacturonyl hydrolase YesR
MKIILYTVSMLLLAASVSCREKGNHDLTNWPAEADPQRVGLLLAEKYLATPHKNSGDVKSEEPPSQIVYSEVCTWLGSIWYAEATGNRELVVKLRERFEPLFDTQSDLLPPPNHVDNNVFGSVPLEFYLISGDRRYLDMGLYYADSQWALPDSAGQEEKAYADRGYTWQTRIWIDDMFMITAVQSQAYRATGDLKYIDRAAKEMILYLDTIQLENGLFYHAPYAHFSWGRGNGWMAAGMSEILRTMPENHPDRPRIMEGYRKMMAALLLNQADDGMWRQVVDDDEFWKETSSTAMFTYAMITGVRNGWLDGRTYGAAAGKAWLSLVKYIDPEGNVTDVCEGTGTSTDRAHYMNRKRNTGDFHGQAPVLWCTAALLR